MTSPLRVLHESSTIGQGFFDPLARTGIHRAMRGVVWALSRDAEIRQGFAALTTRENALGLSLALMDEPNLLPGTQSETWRWLPGTRRLGAHVIRTWVGALRRYPRLHPVRMAHAAAYRLLAASARRFRPVEGFDVLHSWFFPLPSPAAAPGARRLLSVFDVIPLIHPEWFPAGAEAYFREILGSLRPEDWVVCSSEATRRDLLRLHRHPAERTAVIGLAADGSFRPEAVGDSPRIRTTYRLGDRPYFIALGTREPRKNLPRLIAAYAKAFAGRPDAPSLAIAGSPGWGTPVEAALREHETLSDRIILLGRVPDGDLPGLLAGARALAYPSLYEGFGLPPLEAMACGTPVLTSDRSSLPEVVGDAALLVDPADTDQIADGLLRLADDDELISSMRRRSLEQAARFSWGSTASQHLDLYRRIAASR